MSAGPPGSSGLAGDAADRGDSEASGIARLSSLSLDSRATQHAPSAIKSEGIITFDITDQFVAAAKTLKPGQLVKDAYFTLFESVGALEIMDPKMDSGCLAEGESLDPDYDVARRLLPSEVIGIIDQLLCHEIAWHLGYPLSQTILTNIYIENMLSPEPSTIEDADFIRSPLDQNRTPRDPMHTVLRAYCLGLVKSCYHVNERIKYEHYYEEEDFVTNTYHRALLDRIDREEIRDSIQDARTLLHSMDLATEMAQALDFRLQFRFAFLRAIELTELRSWPESIKTPWIEMRAVLEQIRASHPLGEPVPDACSPKLQRRLASTMPPRPIVELSFEEAYGHFKRLCVDGAEVNDVLKYTDSQNLLNFVQWFQSKKPQPLVYIRALLQSYIYKDNIVLGSMSIRQILDDDLALVVLPCSPLLDRANDMVETPNDDRFAVAHQMEMFRQRAAQSYLEIFRALSQNRCRIRRNFCHAIQDWEVLQVDAEEIDTLLQIQLNEKPMTSQTSEPVYSLPLSSWAYFYKLRLMEWIVQLGFELDIYQPDELAGMYYYLSYLASKRRMHIERIRTFTMESMHDLREDGLGPTARPTARQPLNAAKEALFTRSLSFLRTAMVDSGAVTELATALASLYALLYRLKLLPKPNRPYSTDELRFEVRMKPFAAIGLPEMPNPETFEYEAVQGHVKLPDLLEQASAAATLARKSYDAMAKFTEKEAFAGGATHERWVADVKNGAKSCIAAAIAITNIRKAYGNAKAAAAAGTFKEGNIDSVRLGIKAEVPRPEQGYHEWWVVPKIISLPTKR